MGFITPGGSVMYSIHSSWYEHPNGNIFIATSSFYSSLYEGYTWGSYAPGSTNGADTYIWMFNFATLKGMANDDLADDERLSGLTNYFAEGYNFPSGAHFPNVVLFGGYSTEGSARFLAVKQYAID